MSSALPRIVLAACALAGTQAALAAQMPSSHGQRAAWGGVGPAAPPHFGRTAAGVVDGDRVPDLMLERGGTLEVFLGPGLFGQPFHPGVVLDSFVLCPAPNGEPAQSVLCAGSAGLVELRLDRLSSSWSATAIAPAWAEAILLSSRSTPAGDLEVYGVMSDGLSVRRLTRSGSAWIDQPLFTLPLAARDLALVQFDGSGPIELAVASEHALGVVDQSGAVLASWAPEVSSIAIGRVAQPADPRDWIAWLVTSAAGGQELWAVGEQGAIPPAGMTSVPCIVDLATGDVDGDGWEDALISHTAMHHVVLFFDRGNSAGPLFDSSLPGALQLVPIGPAGQPAPENRARPALADVDGDADTDLLMPVQSTGELFVGRNPLVDQDALEPHVDHSDPLLAANLSALPNGDIALDLQLELKQVEAQATHVELILWRRPAPSTPTEPDACDRVLLALPVGATSPCQLEAQLVIPAPPDPIPGSMVRFEGIYVWLARQVRVELAGVTHCFPACVYALETSTSTSNMVWMYSLGGGAIFPVYEEQGGVTLPDQIGCGAELPTLPDFPSGQLPQWN